MTKPDELLPSANEFMKKLALADAEEATKQARKLAIASQTNSAPTAGARSTSRSRAGKTR
jgi:hypothetical protein